MKQPAVQGPKLHPEDIIAVGFGAAGLKKDGEWVWTEGNHEIGDWSDCMTIAQASTLAAATPECDWRIVLHAPLRGSEHQWQDGEWVCIETNLGFA